MVSIDPDYQKHSLPFDSVTQNLLELYQWSLVAQSLKVDQWWLRQVICFQFSCLALIMIEQLRDLLPELLNFPVD